MAKYLELVRVRSVKKPRKDWQHRWGAAVDAARRKGLLTIPKQEERMIAKEGSPIWKKLAEGAGGFRDATGEGEPPFAFGSGMGWKEVKSKELRVKSDNISETTKIAENAKTLREVSLQPKQVEDIIKSAIEKVIPKKPFEMTIKFGLVLAIPLSIFGEPFPPFDWGSGMGVMDVSRKEAIALGLITEEELQAKREELREAEKNKTLPSMNGNLQAEIPFKNDNAWQLVKKALGDQVQVDKQTGTVKFFSEIFKENFDKGNFTFRLGESTKQLINKLPSSVPADSIRGKSLVVTQSYLNKKRGDGIDHRDHYTTMLDHPEDIPLETRDIELLPSMWRNPSRVYDSHGRLVLELDALDGSIYRAVVDIKKDPNLKTFYRTLEPYETQTPSS